MSEVTRILQEIEAGDPQAAEKLLPLVYDELREMAARRLAHERTDHTLEATALVHEAYIRLAGKPEAADWKSRGHFIAAAAQAMRRILVDNARRKGARKRGGAMEKSPLEDIAAPEPDDELIALDEGLKTLAEIDPVKARLVELRYFAGLTGDQAAEVLGISPATADRHWVFARAWLRNHVRGE